MPKLKGTNSSKKQENKICKHLYVPSAIIGCHGKWVLVIVLRP